MLAPECFVACLNSCTGVCRCSGDRASHRPNSLRPTLVVDKKSLRVEFPLDAIDQTAPISNAIVMLCMQALT